VSVRALSIVSDALKELKRKYKAKVHIAYNYEHEPAFSYEPATRTIHVSLKYIDQLLEHMSEELVKCFVKSLLAHELEHYIGVKIVKDWRKYRNMLEEEAFRIEINELVECLQQVK
jgi:hypothetical protein